MYKDIENNLRQYVNELELDLRVNDNHRFTDQKCKPDVVSAVAESILMFIDGDDSVGFTGSDIRNSDFANETIVALFQKPEIGKSCTKREYDKFFSQPIRMFWTAGLIERTGKNGNAYQYKVKNLQFLEYIALSDQRALNFLVILLDKAIKDSGLYKVFEDFFSCQDSASFTALKKAFIQCYLEHTELKKETEIRRIFPQVINPLAFKRQLKGTEGGRISSGPISYASLCYNRLNFRDVKKLKGISRAQFALTVGPESDVEKYQVSRAKRKVKQYHMQEHVPSNEIYIHDATPHLHAHHIFPRALYPEFSDTFENLILINPTQHHVYAHPNGDSSNVSKSYQLLCLLAKLNSIKASEIKNDAFYSVHSYINLVNQGLNHDLLDPSMSIEQIQKELAAHYVDG